MTHSRTRYLLTCLLFSSFACTQASAAPPVLGTKSISNLLKSVATGTDLVCDLDDPRSTLLITEIETPPSFTMETPPGEVIICKEVPRPGSMAAGTADLEFTLAQLGMMPNDGGANGLVVSSADNGDGTRTVTWQFVVDNAGGSNTEILEWRLSPKNQLEDICRDPANTSLFLNPCTNRIGVPASPRVSDYPDRDVSGDGSPDFGGIAGIVFSYTEIVLANGTRLPQTLLFGPCHTGSYNVNDPILCERTQRIGGTKVVLQTRTKGNIETALPVEVNIKPETLNVSQTSGTHDIRILGDANLNPPQVATLEVNGTSLAGSFTSSISDVSGDGFADFLAKVQRPAFARAINCTSNGSVRITITGTLSDPNATRFRGFDTIVINQCNQ